MASLKVLGTLDVEDKLDLPNDLGLTQEGRPSFEGTRGGQCLPT